MTKQASVRRQERPCCVSSPPFLSSVPRRRAPVSCDYRDTPAGIYHATLLQLALDHGEPDFAGSVHAHLNRTIPGYQTTRPRGILRETRQDRYNPAIPSSGRRLTHSAGKGSFGEVFKGYVSLPFLSLSIRSSPKGTTRGPRKPSPSRSLTSRAQKMK